MSIIHDIAFSLGELNRIRRTAKEEEERMTPERKAIINNLIKQANSGSIRAMTTLGNLYWEGTQLRYDPKETCRWWTKAAEAGDTRSMYNLGILYMGNKSKQIYDDKKAAYWLNQASLQGDENAKRVLEENYTYSSLFKKWKRINDD